MPILYIALILCAGFLCMYIVRRQAERRKNAPGGPGFSEFRTALAFDECLDRLDAPSPEDEFQYTCRRQADGSFHLNLTLHQPTNQPMDTVFTLHMDSGRETVISLYFLREAFGYDRPVFPPEFMDRFMKKKLEARRTK